MNNIIKQVLGIRKKSLYNCRDKYESNRTYAYDNLELLEVLGFKEKEVEKIDYNKGDNILVIVTASK